MTRIYLLFYLTVSLQYNLFSQSLENESLFKHQDKMLKYELELVEKNPGITREELKGKLREYIKEHPIDTDIFTELHNIESTIPSAKSTKKMTMGMMGFDLVPDNVERAALVDLYNSTNGASWNTKLNWLNGTTSADFNTWAGVTVTNGDVTGIYLYNNNLNGSIPSSIGDLTELTSLRMSANILSGSIPSSIGSLINLQVLELAANQLSGSIPTQIENLVQVKTLNLSGNLLSGIPASIGNLPQLELLGLAVNQFSGSIPGEIFDITTLKLLTLEQNQFTGSIPSDVGDLMSLESLYLSNNQLTGPIPPEIGNLSNLKNFYAYGNQLASIPSELGNLSLLKQLVLSDNNIEGIPSSFGNLSSLEYLDLSANDLTGSIPVGFYSLSNLLSINLRLNNLTGSLSNQLGNLNKLYTLLLDYNDFSGTIPNSIGNLSQLSTLWLNANSFTGGIPNEVGNLSNLYQINLSVNSLGGSIPKELGSISGLEYLNVGNNQLSGSIPSELGALTALVHLDLRYNQLTGIIPNTFGNLTLLEKLYLESNQLSGAVPSQIGNLTQLTNIDLELNQFTSLPSSIGNLSQLTQLHLSVNRFTQLPSQLASLTSLSQLILVDNELGFDAVEPLFSSPGVTSISSFYFSPQRDFYLDEEIYWHYGISGSYTPSSVPAGIHNVFQWQKYDYGAGDFVDVSGQTSSTISLTSPDWFDAGLYRLKVTNTYVLGHELFSSQIYIGVEDSSTVLPPDAPNVTICQNQPASLTATGSGTMNWYDDSWNLVSTSATYVTPTLTETAYYRVTQTIGGIEGIQKEVIVTVLPTPTITTSDDLQICTSTEVLLSVTGNAESYTWNQGLGAGEEHSVTPTVTTTYTVTGTGANGCQTFADIVITINGLPSVFVTPSSINVCEGGSTTLVASGAYTYQWTHGTGGPSVKVSPTQTTTYTVVGTDVAGCVGTAQSVVTYDPSCPAPPEELRAAALNANTARITWRNVAPGQTGTKIERSYFGSGTFQLIATVSEGTVELYDDPTAQPEERYLYRVIALRGGAESITSDEDDVTMFNEDQHHIRETIVLKEGVTVAGTVPTLPVGERIHYWNYLDGEARTMQQVVQQYSPAQKDLIQPIAYDPLGRQEAQYLPYTINAGSPGGFRLNALAPTGGEQKQFYDGTTTPIAVPIELENPFAAAVFEPSPIGRVNEVSSQGAPWKVGSGKTTKTTYGKNIADEVLQWTIINTGGILSLRSDRYYAADELSRVEQEDAESNKTVSYTDKSGRSILQKSAANTAATLWASNYSVYDAQGYLIFQVSPLAVEKAEAQTGFPKTLDATVLAGLCYQYRYDNQGRRVEVKAPGAEAIYNVYDKWNRLVLSQDGRQRSQNKWDFYKFDLWNRIVMSGIITDTRSSSVIQAALESETIRFETRLDGSGNVHGYTNQAFPTTQDEIHTISYYDDYTFVSAQIGNASFNYDNTVLGGLPTAASQQVQGRTVGTKVAVLGTSQWLWTVSYFDPYDRPVQIVGSNHLGGIDRLSNLYFFPGWVKESQMIHFEGDAKETTLKRRFEYDHVGRLLRTHHQTNAQNEVLMAELSYNELGQVIRKELHKEGGEMLQAVDYRYNIRGWLSGINGVAGNGGDPADYFKQEIAYNETFGSSSLPRHDGNITAAKWKNDLGDKDRLYNYSYDNLGRLLSSDYKENISGAGWSFGSDYYTENNLSYDINGNITTLDRFKPGVTADKVDQLSYAYGTDSNLLLGVTDNSTSTDPTQGFNDGNTGSNDYTYDANGSLSQDLNKGITTITYNALDLPQQVDFSDGSVITYLYDATGNRLSQSYSAGSPLVQVFKADYAGEFVYVDDQLFLIRTPEGRIVPPDFNNLLPNKEANSLEGFTADGDVTLARIVSGVNTYVRGTVNQSTGVHGIWPIGGTINVKAGESYSFEVLGYRTGPASGVAANLYVWSDNGDLVWPGAQLPRLAANEAVVKASFIIPPGVTQIKVGVRWSIPQATRQVFINRVALYKTDMEYQYFLSDHLGSPRVVLQTVPATMMDQATFETGAITQETAVFENINTARVVTNVAANVTPGGSRVIRLNNGYQVGPAKSYKVYPGDKIDASVWAYYTAGSGLTQTPVSTMITAVATALAGGVPGAIDGVGTAYNNPSSNPGILLGPFQGTTKPSAFLNYILFNENFVPVAAQSVPLGDTPSVPHQLMLPTIEAKEVGYLYVYLSYENESTLYVHFDELKIVREESPVIQVNDYYPYGMLAYTWTREGEGDNQYTYQGKEYDSLTQWHDFHARQYDAATGRWFAVDPAAQFSNPYLAMGNSPVIVVDPDGRFIHIIIGGVVGGLANLIVKAVQGKIDNFGDGLAAFGIGAAAGALGAATGGAAFLAAGGAAAGAGGFVAGFVGGAVGSAYAMPIQSIGNHLYFGDPLLTPKEYGVGILTGGLLGGTINGGIAAFNGRSFINGNLKPVPGIGKPQIEVPALGNKPKVEVDYKERLQNFQGKNGSVDDLAENIVDDLANNTKPPNTKINLGDAGKINGTRAPEIQSGYLNQSNAMDAAIKYLGSGYKEVSPGRFVSLDGLRQVRFGAHEIRNVLHIHFEAYNVSYWSGGRVIENARVLIAN